MGQQFFPILVLVLGSAYFMLLRDNYDPKTVAGKRVLVTGASSGIGEELAYHYSRLGARLVLTARRAELLERVSEQCVKLGAKEVSVVPADMAESKDRIKVLEHTTKKLDGLDHLILNHALIRHGPWLSSMENMTGLQMDMNMNFYSYVELASGAMPMLAESQGHVGVVSSISGELGVASTTGYSSSYFATQGFFSSWRQELNNKSTGVSVTLAVLGFVATEESVAGATLVAPGYDVPFYAVAPREAAEAIVKAVELRIFKFTYGWMANLVLKLQCVFPAFVENFYSRFIPYEYYV